MNDELDILIERVKSSTADDRDFARLLELIAADEHGILSARIQAQYLLAKQNDEGYPAQEMDALFARILQGHNQNIDKPRTLAVHRIHFLRRGWFRYAAAILIIVGIGAYIYTLNQKSSPPVATTQPHPVANDILPGTQKAILTLSSGKNIELNSATSETIHDQSLSIENNNGQLIYKNGGMVAMNTMTTPKSGQYQLTLADGTKVWLNAASSITYPTAFKGNNREVSITGEVYFEVAADKSKPFRVKTFKDEITVLGTSFNVNAYPDEVAMKTSLLEGSIRIGKAILQPGQAYQDGKIQKTNIEQDVAWKNGAFNFRNMDIEAAFRQLGRWYNVDIKYAGPVPSNKLGGEIGRDLNLSQVLKALDDIGIHTKIEGNTLVVLPE